MSDGHFLFVYGTLKRGEPNEFVMAEPESGSAVFLGCGITVKKYPLVVDSKFGVPFLLKREGEGYNVKGELYKVDDTKRAFLDDFERHPDLYFREQIETFITEDINGQPVNPPTVQLCWAYLLPRYKPELLEHTTMEEYHSSSKNHPPYVHSADRDESIIKSVVPQ